MEYLWLEFSLSWRSVVPSGSSSMIRRFFLCLVMLVPGLALAGADYMATYQYSFSSGYSWYLTPQEGCNNTGLASNQISRTVTGGPYPAPTYCTTDYTGTTPDQVSTATNRVHPTLAIACPHGGTLNSTIPRMCVGGEPPPPPAPCQNKDPFIVKWFYGQATAPYTMPKNHNGCAIVVDEVLVCRKETIGAFTGTYCMMQVRRTGNNGDTIPPTSPKVETTPDDTAKPKVEMPPTSSGEPDGKCPAGSVQGGVDSRGTPVCIGTGTNPPDAPQPKPSQNTSTTEATPNGGTKTTNTTTYTNADGSTTTNVTITIKNPDGSTSTSGSSTVGTKPAGGQGVDDKPENDKYDLCKQNPMLSICRNSSVSGTCGTITCQGDAIQCATLRAAAAMECRDASDREELAQSPLKSSGAAIIAGADPQKAAIDAAMAGTVVDLSNPNLDMSGFIGGGSCFAPMTINVLGHTVTQSFAEVCDNIVPLRYAIMLCASIISYLIVGRTVLGA